MHRIEFSGNIWSRCLIHKYDRKWEGEERYRKWEWTERGNKKTLLCCGTYARRKNINTRNETYHFFLLPLTLWILFTFLPFLFHLLWRSLFLFLLQKLSFNCFFLFFLNFPLLLLFFFLLLKHCSKSLELNFALPPNVGTLRRSTVMFTF